MNHRDFRMTVSLMRSTSHVVMTLQEGSVSAAADALGLSPSVISQSLRKFEEATGRELFERTGRAVRVKPE